MDEEIPALTKRMVGNDQEAYRRFFSAFSPRMVVYVNKLTSGNREMTEDIVQDALLRVVRHIRLMSSGDEFWCWLVLLMRCAFIDLVRKETRYQDLLKSYAVGLELESAPTPISVGNSEALHNALKRLRKEERKLLLMKYGENSSYREIAGSLEISEKAVESRLGRLRRKLQVYLGRSRS